MRIRNSIVQTPIHEYIHPQDGSDVSIVGMFHVGTSEYYGNVANYIDARTKRGAIVHYEQLKSDPEAEAALPSEIAELLPAFDHSVGGIYGLFPRVFGLEGQEYIPDGRAGWENHDTSRAALARGLGREELERYARLSESYDKVLKLQESNPDFLRFAIASVLRAQPLLRPYQARKYPHRHEVMIEQRNRIALGAVAAARELDPSVMLTLQWGSDHVKGIGRGLQDMGYLRTNKKWLDVFSLRRRPETAEFPH